MPRKKTQEQIVQNLIKLKDGLEEAADTFIKGLNDIRTKYMNDIISEFQFINQHVIDLFYEDYDAPYYYKHRIYDLYDVTEMYIDMETLDPRIESKADNLSASHGLNGLRDYLYDLVYIDGWHGGARPSEPGGAMPDDVLGNPYPGSYDQPYYRSGHADFYLWGKPAVRAGFSPRDEILKEFKDSLDQISKDTIDKLNQLYNNYETKTKKLYKRYLKK